MIMQRGDGEARRAKGFEDRLSLARPKGQFDVHIRGTATSRLEVDLLRDPGGRGDGRAIHLRLVLVLDFDGDHSLIADCLGPSECGSQLLGREEGMLRRLLPGLELGGGGPCAPGGGDPFCTRISRYWDRYQVED